MADDPKKPEDSQDSSQQSDEKAPDPAHIEPQGAPQSTADTHTIISFLDHLAKRNLPKPLQTPEDEPPASDDSPSPWAGQIVSLEEIRRLRQHAADANLPENPLLRYLFEHLMPEYHGGPVNLNVQPEFLQEHARPLLSLLLQSVADSLDGKRKTPLSPPLEPIAPQINEPSLQASTTSEAEPPSEPPPAPPNDGVVLKKNVSFSLDIGKIFKQLFSGDKKNDT